jgi:hypothetical protein
VAIINSIASWWMRKRMHQMELFMKYPHDVQEEWFKRLIDRGKDTQWGKQYKYSSIKTYSQFNDQIPLQDYDSLKSYIERTRKGEQNILWPGEIKWFAKSSGTTTDKSKFIPVTEESLEECHYNGGRDMLAIHCFNHPDTQLFTGKNVGLTGSYKVDNYFEHESYFGDLSAIVLQNLPLWAEFLFATDLSIALLDEWEEKLEKIAAAILNENVTSLAGVPSWMLVLLKRVLDMKGAKHISDVWPNLEVFFHGGVNFIPYKEQFKKLFNSSSVGFIELYNASEGFFGIQDQPGSDELLLMLDYGIYYEFIPMDKLGGDGTAIPLAEVVKDKNYAIVISTSAGLWRYKIGDTVKFTSLSPYRFKITGRTRHFINAFGEELIIENAENALKIACEKTGAIIREFTAAPAYMKESNSGGHEWLIEFEQAPENIGYFGEVLDNALKSLNSDYEAKRYKNFILKAPLIHVLPQGVFYRWMKNRDKLGAQHKVPRLSNDRKYIDELLQLIHGKQ